MLALLIPGVGMSGGVASVAPATTYVVPHHRTAGVKQQGTPSTSGPGLG